MTPENRLLAEPTARLAVQDIREERGPLPCRRPDCGQDAVTGKLSCQEHLALDRHNARRSYLRTTGRLCLCGLPVPCPHCPGRA